MVFPQGRFIEAIPCWRLPYCLHSVQADSVGFADFADTMSVALQGQRNISETLIAVTFFFELLLGCLLRKKLSNGGVVPIFPT